MLKLYYLIVTGVNYRLLNKQYKRIIFYFNKYDTFILFLINLIKQNIHLA